jgi:hypothetical protein
MRRVVIMHVGFVDIGGHETSGDYKNVHVGFVDIGSHETSGDYACRFC